MNCLGGSTIYDASLKYFQVEQKTELGILVVSLFYDTCYDTLLILCFNDLKQLVLLMHKI